MKTVRVITCQVIHQEWQYDVEVEDDFDLTASDSDSTTQARYLLDRIAERGIEGHCRDNDEIRDEIVVEYFEA